MENPELEEEANAPNAKKAQVAMQEQKVVVLVKDANCVNPPRRIDFSGLRPENSDRPTESIEHPKLLIRSGSLTEQREMERLLRDGNTQAKMMTSIDSPAVLVIRSNKHSLVDNEVSEQLEAETYMLMPGTVAWTKATLLKENKARQLNRRGLQTLDYFNKTEIEPNQK